jgi:hypothetical protein
MGRFNFASLLGGAEDHVQAALDEATALELKKSEFPPKDEDEDEDDEDEDEDEDDEDEDAKAALFGAAILSERLRWAAVLGSESAAVQLLSDTDLSAEQIVAIVAKLPGQKDRASKFESAMQTQGNPSIGTGAAQSSNEALDISAAWKRQTDKINARRK